MKNFLLLLFLTFMAFPAIGQAPTVAAPTPTCPSGDVISMFSEAYTDVPVATWLTVWSSATGGTIVPIAGNDTRLYENVDFLGIEPVAQIDASAMNTFNIDVWTPNMTTFRVKLVNFGPGGNSEFEIAFTPTLSGWNTYAIPMADFTGLTGTSNIAQLILSGIPIGGGTLYIDNVYFSSCGVVAPTTPTVAAPTPTCAPADVISMFSEAYTDVPVATWLTVWSSATGGTIVPIAGNDTRLYESVDFLGIEPAAQIDASAMTTFNIDVWTPDMTLFRVKLVNFGPGGNSEFEIAFTPVQGGWNTYSIPMADFTGLTGTSNIAQLILSGQPIGTGTLYIDNVYFSSCAATAPIVAAPAPTCAPGDVISMFSEAYTDVPVATWLTVWSSATGGTIVPIGGNDTRLYENVDFLGIEPVTQIDASAMTYFNIDVWTPNMTTFRVKLVNFGPGGNSEFEIAFTPVQGGWNTYSIPMASFTGLTGTSNIAQLILSGIPIGGGTLYIDNVYFSTCVPDTDVTLCVDMSCFDGVQAPSVFGAFNGWNAGANPITDPDGDGFYCATVSMAPGAQQYKFFDQLQGPENFTSVGACNILDGVNINRVINVTAGVPQTVMFGWETCDPSCTPPTPPNVELCVDMSCLPGVQAPSVFGAFNGWNAGANQVSDPDGDGVYCTTVLMAPGDHQFKFFDQLQGPELFLTVGTCNVLDGVNINRTINVTGAPQSFIFGWQSCDATCTPPYPAPDLPIIFDDQSMVNYAIDNFGGMIAAIGVDPTDPSNAVICATKPAGAQCWAGTTIGGQCLENPVPFAVGSMVLTMDVYSPNVNTPFLLKVEDCNNGAISSEVLAFTTVANAWETLVFDFSAGCGAPPNLANTYSKLSVFSEFSCSPDACGTAFSGNTPTSGLTYYFDNIMMCDLPLASITCPPTIALDCTDAIPAAATNEASFIAQGGMIDNPCKNPLTVTSVDDVVMDGSNSTLTRTYTVSDGTITLTCDQVTSFTDATGPTIVCPPSSFGLTCNSDLAVVTSPTDFIALGGTISDDCTTDLADFVISYVDSPVNPALLNYCPTSPAAERTITRTYTITDAAGNPSTCTQSFVFSTSQIGPIITSIPLDQTIDCSFNAMPQLHLFKADAECGLDLTYTVEEATQSGTSNCPGSSIQYVYTVTDACGRMASHTQSYTLANEGPEFVCPQDICIIDCPADTDMIQSTFDNYANLATVNSSCSGTIGITNNFSATGFNNVSCGQGPFGYESSVAWQMVTFTATDQCGRTGTCTAMVIIKDTTGPEMSGETIDAIRYNNAAAQSEYDNWIMANMDNLAATNDECNGTSGTVSWSFTPTTPNTTEMTGPFAVTETTFTATDGCGNETSVTALFKLKDEPTANTGTITGTITDEQNEEVEDVEVELMFSGQGQLGNVMTGADGFFEFEVETGENYEVIPSRNDNPLNGVSTMDLILISKHILGMEDLDSPYKMIAADVNKSGAITGGDLVEIRKLILFMIDNFENNTSWQFIDGDYVFPNPTNPFANTFPTLHSINGLSDNTIANFIGVKTGDVNNSVVLNQFSNNGDTRSNQTLVLGVEDQALTAGETYVIDFKANDFKNIMGYQFSLNFELTQLDFVDLTTGDLPGLSADNFGTTNLNEGVITSSWNQREALSLLDETVLFSLTFKAKSDTQLSKALRLSSQLTASEAYNEAVELLELDLAFEGASGDVVAAPFALFQNQPNPFKDNTVIGFNLPEASDATLTIFDLAGRILKQETGNFAAGYNQINLEKATFNHVGLMYYTLQTATDSATKKMILISN